MSDSEEEAFQSADEGEGTKDQTVDAKSEQPSKDQTKQAVADEPSTEKVMSPQKQQKGKKGKQKAAKKKQHGNEKAAKTDKPSAKDSSSSSTLEQKDEKVTSEVPSVDKTVDPPLPPVGDTGSETVTEPTQPVKEEIEQISNITSDNKKDNETVAVSNEEIEDVAKDTENDQKSAIIADTLQETPEQSKESSEQERLPQSALDRLTGSSEGSSGWGSWGSWGTSLLSTATHSVSTFSHQVGEGLHTVMEAVDGSLGAVPPEEMVKIQLKEAELVETDVVLDKDGHEVQDVGASVKEPEENDPVPADTEADEEDNVSSTGGWFSAWGVNTITQAVKSTVDTSKHLVEGSLDVLETIGKKTVDVLKENDPGFAKTKELIQGEKKPNLSELLQNAKIEAEEKAKEQQELEKAQTASFSLLFDEFQGLAHIEALEMLSRQSEPKVVNLLEALPSEVGEEAKTLIDDIDEKLNIEDIDEIEDEEAEHDFVKLVTNHLTDVHMGTTPDKLNQAHLSARDWLTKSFLEQAAGEALDPQDLHEKSLRSLAEITAKCVEQFHKAGELILLQKDYGKDFLSRAESLASLTRVVCTEIQILSNKFTRCLSTAADDAEDPDEVNPLLTEIYLEATNSNQYVMDSLKLLLPVLQQAALEALAASGQTED